MSELIHKKHNVSVLLYHLVCPTKYRKAVITPDIDEKLKEICEQISLRYEMSFWRSELTQSTCIFWYSRC